MGQRNIYIEFRQIAKQIKVSAIDSVTGVEVSIFGPLDVSKDELTRIAVNKLQMRLRQLQLDDQ